MSIDKQSESFPGRNFYRGNGVNWMLFLPWMVAAWVGAGALAVGMFLLFNVGQYYIILVPAIAALGVAGLISLAVKLGHCRNALVGGLAGFIAGVLLYLGSYYFGMIYQMGTETAGSPQMFWLYLRVRMATDVTHDTHDYGREEEPARPSPGNKYMNWGKFAFELGMVLLITTGIALKGSRRAYCTACRRWMTRELTPFDPAQATELVESLRSGSARALAALCSKAPFATVPNTSLAIDYCPAFKEGMTHDCPVYVSVKNVMTVAPGGMANAFEHSKGKMLVRSLQSNPGDLAALALRFPFLEAHTGRSAVAALAPKEESAAEPVEKAGTFAEITALDSEYAGKIMTRKTVLIGNALALGGLFGFLAAMGILVWGGMTAFPDHPPAGGVSPVVKAGGIALMCGGGVLGLVVLGILFTDSSFLGNRYVRNRLRQELARRTSLMVDPHEPEALLVEVVPKTNWGKVMLENASDVGLLLVDVAKREVRFEGDRERWRIPAAAITHCGIEKFVQGHTHLYYVVLRANHRSGFWEAPLRERRGTGLLSWKQRKAARRLVERIQQTGVVGLMV